MVLKNLFTGQQWRNRHRDMRTYGHGEKGREREMYGKSNMETYITICKIDSQWEFAVWLRKLKQGLCINLEGWGGERDGRRFQKRGIRCIRQIRSVAQSCPTLRPHESQHARPPCPSPTPRVHPDSRPSSQ